MLAITAGVVAVGTGIATIVTWLLGRITFGAVSAQEWWVPGAATGDDGWLAPIKVALTVAAGVGAAVALVVAYRKQKLAERTERYQLASIEPREVAADKRAEETHRRNERQADLDAYGAAAVQLGSVSAATRLAGVYALSNIADQRNLRKQCIEVLCAYLRVPWTHEASDSLASVETFEPDDLIPGATRKKTYPSTAGEAEVRRAILKVIADHLRGSRYVIDWQFEPFDLSNATLPELDWSGCRFSEQVTFAGATFTGRTNFSDTIFESGADFSSARALEDGQVMFRAAQFGADPSPDDPFKVPRRSAGASPDADFRGAKLGDSANFHGVAFGGAAHFEDAVFGEGASFTSGSLGLFSSREAEFHGPALFQRASFGAGANFSNATFGSDARFESATLGNRAHFDGVVFKHEARFEDAVFGDGASFTSGSSGLLSSREAEFHGPALFQRASFGAGANFSNATFGMRGHLFDWSDDPPVPNFDGATFSDAPKFEDAKFARPPLIAGTTIDGRPAEPSDFITPDAPEDVADEDDFVESGHSSVARDLRALRPVRRTTT